MEKEKLITRKTKIKEIVENYPKVAEELMSKYRLYCVACPAAGFETLEQGAQAHGMGGKRLIKWFRI